MIVKYGNYSFADGECAMVNFSASPKLTPRNVRRSTVVTMHCAGEFCFPGEVTQGQIKTKIEGAKAALDEDYKDLILLHNDGTTESPYKLINDDPQNATGNIVVKHSWPSNVPEDYATTKQFEFAVEAEFYNPNVTLLDYSQSIEVIGTAGPVTNWSRLLNGQWQRKIVHLSSTKMIYQTGYAVGFLSYPAPSPPLLNAFYEHEQHRRIKRTGPSLFWGRPYEYMISWSYVFETPLEFTPANAYPSLR